MKLTINGWADGDQIPEKFAFGRIPNEGRFSTSDNISPELSWSDVPAGTKSFAVICHDPDVPSKPDDVNQEGKTVSKDLPRVDFYHWVLVDIPASTTKLEEGAGSIGVVPKGKPHGCLEHGVAGINSYTDWFAGDSDMGGEYGDYDGPCPPWNDEQVHRYYFTVYALGVESLGLTNRFGGAEALAAMEGHVLGHAQYRGTYTMNRDL